jgi:phage repressor protein C with HTH and peptisase S24 domain
MPKQLDDFDAEEVDEALLQRFKEVVEAAGTRQRASELTGNSTQQISKWIAGRARIPFRQAAILARAANRSLDWLASGEGSPFLGPDFSGPSTLPQLSQSDGDDDVVFIPLLDVVASAGPGIENPFPDAIDHLPFPKRWLDELGVPESFARLLELGGDSMEPTIRDRSICLLDTRFQTPRVEGIYALIDGKDVRIKRIGRGWEGKIVLISDNERYDSETLAGPDAEALRIAGKIVWAGGKL